MSKTQTDATVQVSTVSNFLNELQSRLDNAYETAYDGSTSKGDIEVALTTIAEFRHFIGADEA